MISYSEYMSGFKCANCGKGVMYGHNVSHAKNRTRRIFKPNLHNFKGMRYCTKCLRKVKSSILKVQRVVQAPKVESIAPPSL